MLAPNSSAEKNEKNLKQTEIFKSLKIDSNHTAALDIEKKNPAVTINHQSFWMCLLIC